MEPIIEIGTKIDVPGNAIMLYGPHKAKLTYENIECDVWDLF